MYETIYNLTRSVYRFTVGTVSGAVGWTTYVGIPVVGYQGYQHFAQVKASSVNFYDQAQQDYLKSLPTSSDITAKKDAIFKEAPGYFDQAYGYVVSLVKKVKDFDTPKSLFDAQHKKDEEGSDTDAETAIVNGALSVVKGKFDAQIVSLEERIGSLDQYKPAAKLIGGAFVAHKMGLFETASVLSKQAELTVESWFGVNDDAYGLFDMPAVLGGGIYKTSVATVSKIAYVCGGIVGGASTVAGPALLASVGKYVYKNGDYSVASYANQIKVDVVENQIWYAGGTALFSLLNSEGVVQNAAAFAKNSELAFEHAFGLSGDTPGLLDGEFWS